MAGFKTGASADDPLGGDEDDAEENQTTVTRADTDTDTDNSASIDVEPTGSDRRQPAEETSPDAGGQPTLPWIYARSSITDGREKTVQLHLQSSTLDRQREALVGVEERVGESVKKADLREAALLVGMNNLDEVADVLREWGYDLSTQ